MYKLTFTAGFYRKLTDEEESALIGALSAQLEEVELEDGSEVTLPFIFLSDDSKFEEVGV